MLRWRCQPINMERLMKGNVQNLRYRFAENNRSESAEGAVQKADGEEILFLDISLIRKVLGWSPTEEEFSELFYV